MTSATRLMHTFPGIQEARPWSSLGALVRVAPCPSVFPQVVEQFSVAIDAAHPEAVLRALGGFPLPPELRGAPPRRQAQFLAGRFCVMQAMHPLASAGVRHPLPRLRGGVPAWPHGISGSIAHTDGFVTAAVVRTSQVSALGIDTERVIDAERARRVATEIAWPVELSYGRDAGLDRLQALTLAFCAKQAIFKCLYAQVGGLFGFHDVRLTAVHGQARTFRARVAKTLAPRLPCDTVLAGRFDVDGSFVHAGLTLAPAIQQ